MVSIIEKALEYYGEKEVEGPGSNPVILGIINTMAPWISDDSKIAWCAIFANYVAKESKREFTGKMTARSFLDIGVKIPFDQAKPGDVVVLWRVSPDSWQGHVTFFVNWRGTDQFRGLGGNQANGINIRTYPNERILAIIRLGINDL